MMKRYIMIAALLGLITGAAWSQKKSYTADVRPLFTSYGCLDCHGGTNNLFLGTYAQVFTTGLHAPVIVAKDSNSVLILKLKGTAGFGARMPQGGAAIAAADLRTIIQWVMDGAPENPTAVAMHVAAGPGTFQLEQNYPNPFNPSTTIRFSVAKAGRTTLSVHDVAGREVLSVLDQELSAGAYSVPLDASTLSSGMYFYTLRSAGSVQTRKLALVK